MMLKFTQLKRFSYISSSSGNEYVLDFCRFGSLSLLATFTVKHCNAAIPSKNI